MRLAAWIEQRDCTATEIIERLLVIERAVTQRVNEFTFTLAYVCKMINVIT